MARKEIQHTVNGRLLGLSPEGWLVINLPDKRQIVVSDTGLLLTDASNNTTTVSGTGTGVARSIPYSTAIDLTTTGSGSEMTETTLSLYSVFTVAAGVVNGGNCTFVLVGDGTHTPDMSAFVSGNGYAYNPTLGARNLYVAVEEFGSPILYGSLIGDAGSGTPTPYSTTIPLDTPEAGKYMPQTVLSANSVFSVGANPKEMGNCNFSLVGDGVHSPDLSAFRNANNYTYSSAVGSNNIYTAVYAYGSPLVYGAFGTPVFLSFPTLLSATVPDTDATRINLVWSRSMNSTVSASSAFAVSAGHSLTSHTYDTATTSHLVTSTAFVQGETKTLAYTIPGSNPMQDASGNQVQTFTGTTITDSVTTPTLTSAIVANSTPTKIDLTWSRPINSTVSAYTNFAVSSGHTLTAHAYVDATHSQLTTSAAFVNGETKTLAYTPNGTNDMQDTNGNKVAAFSGTAITDNVGASGVFVRLDTNVGADVSESGSAGAGYNYIGLTGSNVYTLFRGAASTKTLASSTDGYIRCTLNAVTLIGDVQFILAFSTVQTVDFPPIYGLGISGSYVYAPMLQYGTGTANGVASRTPNNGDYIRLRRSGSTIVGEVSSDLGANWVTIHTYSSASTAALYAQMYVCAQSGGNVVFSDVMA